MLLKVKRVLGRVTQKMSGHSHIPNSTKGNRLYLFKQALWNLHAGTSTYLETTCRLLIVKGFFQVPCTDKLWTTQPDIPSVGNREKFGYLFQANRFEKAPNSVDLRL